MEYRTLPHGGEKISVIGLGSAGLHNASDAEVERTIDEAVDAGVNHFDFIPSESRPLAAMGRTLRRHRADVHVQVHIGALYGSGAYGWTTDAKPAIAEFEQRLATIGTDYADFGFIHCIDEDADLDRVMNGGIWDYVQARHADGTIPSPRTAECVGCGHCDSRCPFGVAQSSRMREIAAYFGM